MNRQHLRNLCIALLAAPALSGCIMDNLEECPNEYELRLTFTRNMLDADAFASRVKSVDIKVFDSASGREVFAWQEEGAPLAADGGYKVALPVPPGSYNILCWAGMAEGNSFSRVNPAADILEHHDVRLSTDAAAESSDRLNDLFHGLKTDVTFIDNNTIGSTLPQTVTLDLTKNTNRINVLLHNLDGTEIKEGDFTFSITSANAEMAFDNSLRAQRGVVYRPWAVTPIVADTGAGLPDGGDAPRALVQSALSAEFSTGRLDAKASSRLDIWRTADGERIISVPLESNLLLYKGEFHSSMTDRDYLDRQDDYTITFILDKNNNWDKAAMIYINKWATLPIQYQEW